MPTQPPVIPTPKIPATKIQLVRAEGSSEECYQVTIEPGSSLGADLWAASDAILRTWAQTAPAHGGYDKCDFTIVYADGETYQGRFDLERAHGAGDDLLADHVRAFIQFHSGRGRPTHLTERQYQTIINRLGPEQVQQYANFLDTYEIGKED